MLGNEKLANDDRGRPREAARVSGFGDCPQPVARVKPEKKFFIFFRCNPLKSPDSAKGIQGNARIFPWFSLDSFGFSWREFARWLNPRPPYRGQWAFAPEL